MYYFLLIVFALLPSFIWLLFFLRKDAHPESNRMVLKIFFWGMLATLPIISFSLLTELFDLAEPLSKFLSSSILIQVLYLLLGVALVEETLKYLVVSGEALPNSELDEPLDIMLYMVIAALGFAALENILYLFRIYLFPPTDIVSPVFFTNIIHSLGAIFGHVFPENVFYAVFLTNVIRFIGAVFGHALWSGTLGYFLALSFYEPKKRLGLLTLGLFLAVSLHAAFNYAIMQIAETGNLTWFLFIIMMLIGLAIFVTLGFKRLQKMKSICKIK
jgi:RsiW-degrading membrane proteinase PrsW (M82 family)